MKSLFNNETMQMNEEGSKVAREIFNLLEPIYKKHLEDGFNARELTYIINSEAYLVEACQILTNRHNKKK